jgi:two-component system, OmpR family, response regulator
MAPTDGAGVDRILVIDPDDRVAALISRELTDRGFAVDRIDGGPRVAEVAIAGDYELVLLELVLPGIDGRRVLETICTQRPDRKVFVVSARVAVADRVDALELGAVDYLCKPFDLRELLARIEVRIFEGRPKPAGHRLSGANLALDPAGRRVRRGGSWIDLTDREYLLLSHLVGSGTRICSREELLSRVWGITDGGTSTHVEMYVHKLRSKLGRDAIKTVRGAGYCVAGTAGRRTRGDGPAS